MGCDAKLSTALALRESNTVSSIAPNRDNKLCIALMYGGSFPVSSVLSTPGYQRYAYPLLPQCASKITWSG